MAAPSKDLTRRVTTPTVQGGMEFPSSFGVPEGRGGSADFVAVL